MRLSGRTAPEAAFPAATYRDARERFEFSAGGRRAEYALEPAGAASAAGTGSNPPGVSWPALPSS